MLRNQISASRSVDAMKVKVQVLKAEAELGGGGDRRPGLTLHGLSSLGRLRI